MNATTRRHRATLRARGRYTRGMARRRRERWHLIRFEDGSACWIRLWVTPRPLALKLFKGVL